MQASDNAVMKHLLGARLSVESALQSAINQGWGFTALSEITKAGEMVADAREALSPIAYSYEIRKDAQEAK